MMKFHKYIIYIYIYIGNPPATERGRRLYSSFMIHANGFFAHKQPSSSDITENRKKSAFFCTASIAIFAPIAAKSALDEC